MVSIAITPKYVHITPYKKNGLPGYTKSFRNDKVRQYSRNRVYRFAKANVTRATVSHRGTTQYYCEGVE